MENYVTVKQACVLTSRTQPAINNFCRAHFDGINIKKENRKYYISISFLKSFYKLIETTKSTNSTSLPPQKDNSLEDEKLRLENESLKALLAERERVIQEQNARINDLREDKKHMRIQLDESFDFQNMLKQKLIELQAPPPQEQEPPKKKRKKKKKG